jgi:hypothetical protein
MDRCTDDLTPEEEYFIQNGSYPDEQINTITPSSISMQITSS